MPRTLKRRSEAMNEDEAEQSQSPERGPQRQRRSISISSAGSSSHSITPDPDQNHSDSQTTTQDLVKKLVRLALSSEYARLPLRRSDISQKILKDNHASHRLFKPVFAGAQRILAQTFGMTLVELPSREKTTLKDRRAQATQSAKSQSQAAANSNKLWILVSTLPDVYKRNPKICQPTRAPSKEAEAEYTALYTFVLSLIYLNGSALTDAKLERYLKRVNADAWTPVGSTEKLLARMVKEGYVEKRRDTSSGEEVVEWVVGPRGKVEVGVQGVARLVKGVYGFGEKKEDNDGAEGEPGDPEAANGVKIEEEELDRKLERSLGFKISDGSNAGQQQVEQATEVEDTQQNAERPRRGRPRRNRGDSDDD